MNSGQRFRGRAGRRFITTLLLLAGMTGAASAQYTPAAWPATFVDYRDSTGNYIQDISDQNPSYTDIIFSASTPSSVMVAYDGTTAFFRLQLADNAWRSNGSWAPYAWVVALSGPTGQGEPIGFVSVSGSGSSLDVEVKDQTTTDRIYTYAKTNPNPAAVRSVPAGLSGYYYLDFQVPMAAMTARIGIDGSTPLRLFYGTSASGGTINKDFMTGGSVNFLGLGTTNFNGIMHGSITVNPVELTSFSAYRKNGAVALRWNTATELNNFGFEVQRTEDGNSWRMIGFVAGAGTVYSPRAYEFEDRSLPTSGYLRYRLRQVDRDGSSEYSPVVEVRTDAQTAPGISGMFPSPARAMTTVSYSLESAGTAVLTLHDLTGRQLRTLSEEYSAAAGSHSSVVDVSGLTTGIYLLQLRSEGDMQVIPMQVHN